MPTLPQRVEHKLPLFVYECGVRRLHNYQSILSWRAKQSLSSNCKGDEPCRVVGDLARESPSIYLHLRGLVTRSASIATSVPTIMGAGIVPFVWLQVIHGAATGS